MQRYDERRLMELAKNILFGMDVVDKRVDNLPKNVKKELNEREQFEAELETRRFFNSKETQRRLEKLKSLIVDDSSQKKFEQLWSGDLQKTPQSRIDEMNETVSFNPYSVRDY